MKVFRIIINIFMVVAAVATLAMLTIVVLDVILRYFFKAPIVGATEISQMLMVCILPALGGTILEGRMTQVDILVEKFPASLRVVVDSVMNIVTIILFGLLTWQAFKLGVYEKTIGKVYSLLKVPEYPFLFLLAFSFAVAGIATIICFVLYLKKCRKAPPAKTVADAVAGEAAELIEIAEEETDT